MKQQTPRLYDLFYLSNDTLCRLNDVQKNGYYNKKNGIEITQKIRERI